MKEVLLLSNMLISNDFKYLNCVRENFLVSDFFWLKVRFLIFNRNLMKVKKNDEKI